MRKIDSKDDRLKPVTPKTWLLFAVFWLAFSQAAVAHELSHSLLNDYQCTVCLSQSDQSNGLLLINPLSLAEMHEPEGLCEITSVSIPSFSLTHRNRGPPAIV